MSAICDLLEESLKKNEYIVTSVTFKLTTLKKLEKLQKNKKKKIARSAVIELLVDDFCARNGIEV